MLWAMLDLTCKVGDGRRDVLAVAHNVQHVPQLLLDVWRYEPVLERRLPPCHDAGFVLDALRIPPQADASATKRYGPCLLKGCKMGGSQPLAMLLSLAGSLA